jgi:hypothetical protein
MVENKAKQATSGKKTTLTSQSYTRLTSLADFFLFAACSAYTSTLKMEAICSFETSMKYYRDTRGHIAEDNTLHLNSCDNFNS